VQESVQRFVEQMGLMCENEGLPRNAGRILGLLLAQDGPFSLDELADELRASKASVSTNARMLEQQGMIRRVGTPGDRRDFYAMDGDPWESMLDVGRVRWRQMVRVLEEAAAELPAENEKGRQRLRDAALFHLLLLEESQKLVEAWRRRRSAATGPPAETPDVSK
jgi:DNA-binding transcriptional regulator GbsR (MarR family)